MFESSRLFVARVAIVILCVFGLTGPLAAQSVEVTGTVTDQQRGVIVGAAVTLRAGTTEQNATTDAQGRYRFSAVTGDTLTLTIEAPGFQPRTITGLSIGTGSAVVRDIELAIAGGVEIVNVAAAGFVERAREESANQSTVRKTAVTLLGTAAQTNLYKPLDLLPSLHVETADPYGLSSRQPWNVRVRGQAGIGTGMMVDGIPIWGVESPGPRVDMFDLENVDGITFFRGSVPPNQGLGGQDIAGSMDIRQLPPNDRLAVTATQAMGSWGLQRTFLRLDTGRFQTGTKLFGAYSHTEADKWKGTGQAPRYRQHVAFGVEQQVTPRITAGLTVDYNEQEDNSFRGLSYAQIQDLDTFASFDFNGTLSSTPADNGNYFNFNRAKTRDVNVASRVTARLSGDATFTVRPYYWTENRRALASAAIPGAGLNGIRQRTNQFDRGGAVAEWQTTTAFAFRVAAGYWFESFNLPIAEKYYTIASNGDLLFNRWALNGPDRRGLINSPYLTVSRNLGPSLRVDAGVRYFHLRNPGQVAYVTTGLGDISFDEALDSGSAVDAPASFAGNTQAPWLPYVGLNYTINQKLTAYANYGRNYARSHGYPELMQTYLSARAAYAAAGVDMQYLYDQFGLATSANYEGGVRLNLGSVYLAPLVFSANYRNKLISVFDPIAGRGIRQAVGEVAARGFELEAGANPMRALALYGSASYNSSEIQDNLRTATNTFLEIKGKQTPDTPQLLFKAGATWSAYGVSVSPIVRFVDARYGDALNVQKVPSYTVTDLTISSALNQLPGLRNKTRLNGLTVTLSGQNLFDRQYVGVIGAFEDATNGSFFAGAPRTLSVKFGVAFGG